MKTINNEAEYKKLVAELNNAGCIADNRFAVIAERLYEVTFYDDIGIITVSDAEGAHNSSFSEEVAGAVFIEALVYEQEESDDVNEAFIEVIKAALAASF